MLVSREGAKVVLLEPEKQGGHNGGSRVEVGLVELSGLVSELLRWGCPI